MNCDNYECKCGHLMNAHAFNGNDCSDCDCKRFNPKDKTVGLVKLLVIFGKPYFQVTVEEGESEKHCIQKALTKLNRDFLNGSESLDGMIDDNAEQNSKRDDRSNGNFRFFLSSYVWDIKTYDGKHIKDENIALSQIRYDIEAKTVEKSNALVKEYKIKKYEQLKEELGIP